MNDHLVPLAEVVVTLGLRNYWAARWLVSRGDLLAVRVGGKVMVLRASLEAYESRQRAAAT